MTTPTERGLTRRRLISSLAAGTAATFLATGSGALSAAPPFAYCGYTAMFASYPNFNLVDLD